MPDIIAEETTTLPEGASVSVYRINRAKLGPCNMLQACHNNNIVKMRADDISPSNLRWYLSQCLMQINRERVKITVKPGMLIQNPKGFREFTNNMAFYGMFMFAALEDSNYNDETGHTTAGVAKVSKPKKKAKKVRRQRKPKTSNRSRLNGTNPF